MNCMTVRFMVDAFLFLPLEPNKEHIVGRYIGVTICFVFLFVS